VAAKVRVGIVGATVTAGGIGWGANAHAPALNVLPANELKAVCTTHAETARAAAVFGAAARFTTLRTWLPTRRRPRGCCKYRRGSGSPSALVMAARLLPAYASATGLDWPGRTFFFWSILAC
jgi:hypothetical protein